MATSNPVGMGERGMGPGSLGKTPPESERSGQSAGFFLRLYLLLLLSNGRGSFGPLGEQLPAGCHINITCPQRRAEFHSS